MNPMLYFQNHATQTVYRVAEHQDAPTLPLTAAAHAVKPLEWYDPIPEEAAAPDAISEAQTLGGRFFIVPGHVPADINPEAWRARTALSELAFALRYAARRKGHEYYFGAPLITNTELTMAVIAPGTEREAWLTYAVKTVRYTLVTQDKTRTKLMLPDVLPFLEALHDHV